MESLSHEKKKLKAARVTRYLTDKNKTGFCNGVDVLGSLEGLHNAFHFNEEWDHPVHVIRRCFNVFTKDQVLKRLEEKFDLSSAEIEWREVPFDEFKTRFRT